MRGKTKKLVTYGKASSHNPPNLKNGVQDLAAPHTICSEGESAKASCSSPLTKSLDLSHHDAGSQSTSSVDIPGSQSSQGKAYDDVSGKKRRKLFRENVQQIRDQSMSVNSDTAPTSAHRSYAEFGKTTSPDCAKSNEVFHMGEAQDRGTFPRKAQFEIEPLGANFGAMSRSPYRVYSSKAASLPISCSHDEDTTRYHKRLPTIRKRLVDSLSAAEEFARDGIRDTLTDRDYQSDCHSLSQLIWEEKDRQSTADIHQSKAPSTDSAEPSGIPKAPRFGRSRVTYAHQRSFLNDASTVGLVDDPGISVSTMCCNPRRPQPSPGLLSQAYSHVEDEESLDNRPVQSIHELRQAGDNARFQETVELVFEDIEDPHNSVSEACNGFLQLCTRLMEPQFLRRFCESGFDIRLVKCMTNDLDIVSTTLALCAFRLIYVSGSLPPTLLTPFWSKLLDISSTLIGAEDDLLLLARQRPLGLSKAVQASLKALLPRLSLAVYGEQPITSISPRLLILLNIQSALLIFQEKGTSVDIPVPLLTPIVGLLSPETCENAKFPLPLQRFHVLVLALSILEAYTMLSGPLDADHRNSFQPLTRYHSLLYADQTNQSRQVLVLYIRVLLNLTNRDPSFCEACCRPEFVGGLVNIITSKFCAVSEEAITKENSALDTIILALGALINMAEKSELSRSIFLESMDNSASFLHLLLQQFSAGISSVTQAHSVSEMQHNVAIGYLSILLVTLCLNKEALAHVKASLHGRGLTSALSTAEEFLRYHQKVEKDSHLLGTRNKDGAELTSRLEQIIYQIRQHVEQ
ncbi:WAPL family protein [Aspergillus alliaceus]|uniref:WAPL family protein n=1 Tax=Petromyces alliaceus TaxID=209559 RepID=UPI0012A5B3B2|nr:wings apart-like protein regulation of heterochromatin-domain-containing protein [Aspergillus alliaceus]KAB8232184.1 wings apart-like protein regulation of heterochromatin-domain-containing protein [Aspergillus alliaceus]